MAGQEQSGYKVAGSNPRADDGFFSLNSTFFSIKMCSLGQIKLNKHRLSPKVLFNNDSYYARSIEMTAISICVKYGIVLIGKASTNVFCVKGSNCQ